MTVRLAKTQISLSIRPVWSESSLCAQWVAKDPSFLHAESEDSNQTWRMLRLIWVFAGCTFHFVGSVLLYFGFTQNVTEASIYIVLMHVIIMLHPTVHLKLCTFNFSFGFWRPLPAKSSKLWGLWEKLHAPRCCHTCCSYKVRWPYVVREYLFSLFVKSDVIPLFMIQ